MQRLFSMVSDLLAGLLMGLLGLLCSRPSMADPSPPTLAGRVQLVQYRADLKVQVVRFNEDLAVQWVEYNPHDTGQWQSVQYNADWRIKIVEHDADLRVRFVEYNPGWHSEKWRTSALRKAIAASKRHH